VALSQALRARLRSVLSLRDALADISEQHRRPPIPGSFFRPVTPPDQGRTIAGCSHKKTALHPDRAANDNGPYDTQTIVRDPGSLCSCSSSDFDLVCRQSNGCSTGDAQNDRDEQSWLLKSEDRRKRPTTDPKPPLGRNGTDFHLRLMPAWQIAKDFCAMQAKSTESYVCY
jgi:hypothetical protein